MSKSGMLKLAKLAESMSAEARALLAPYFERLGTEREYHSGLVDGIALAARVLSERGDPISATLAQQLAAVAAARVIENRRRQEESRRWANSEEVRPELNWLQGQPADAKIIPYDLGDCLREIEESMEDRKAEEDGKKDG
jgi:hypothetical protein